MLAAKRQPGAGAGMGQSSTKGKGSLRRGAFFVYIEDGIYWCYNINTFWITLLMLFGYAGKARVCGRAFFVENIEDGICGC
jgi:hypothetical protein